MEKQMNKALDQTGSTLLKMASIIQSGYGKPDLDANGAVSTSSTLLTAVSAALKAKEMSMQPADVLTLGEAAAHLFAAEPGNASKLDAAAKKAIDLLLKLEIEFA
jgi:hypothetical protein